VCRVYGITISEAQDVQNNMGYAQRAVRLSLIPTEKKYIQINGSQFYPLKKMGFKKNMKEIFSSCQPIVDGLETKRYTFDNWQTLIADYNAYANKAH
jgi:hypothetical protein